MIGRYRNPAAYRQLLQMKKFYQVALGVLMMAAAYFSGEHHLLHPLFSLGALGLLGVPIMMEAAKGLLRRELNVDELVSLAIIASVVVGEYFSAAVVALIMELGSLLEEFYAQKARASIEALAELSPRQASVLRNGKELSLPVSEIRKGDRVIVRSGERIPVDGQALQGEASINESSLTGEAMPVSKHTGSEAFAGTLVYTGMLELEATRVGQDTTLEKLIRLVEEAETQKAPVYRTADRFARYFTPAIITLALLVYLFTGEAYRAITVLIVGCPCAFVLATPTAVVSALGNASRHGIVIKGGHFLEEISRINALLFDKTGTLTTGQPVVNKVEPVNGYSTEQVLSLAAAAEKHSRHPLARAVAAAAEQRKLQVPEASSFRDHPGKGVEAQVGENRVFVGEPLAGTSKGGPLPVSGGSSHSDPAPTGGKRLKVKKGEEIIGYLSIEEEVRPEVPKIVYSLAHAHGVEKMKILTGDSAESASYLAADSGIGDYRSGLLPGEKLEIIKELQSKSYKVSMVGDGVNDAPSLAAANIGIAMEAMGTDVALESSDVALMNDDLRKLPHLFALGKATLRTIHFNIAFAMVFNAVALAASSAGLLTPIAGAVVHNAGSILVVLNSARLTLLDAKK